MKLDRPIAFVTPWYGAEISGGAEALCREFCQKLRLAGQEVKVLTTCARDFAGSWGKDYHQPGISEERGVPVHRFPLRKRNRRLFDAINFKLLNNSPTTPHEEIMFYAESVRSTDLERHIEQHARDCCLIVIPYCFGVSYYSVMAAKGRALMIPCLHQESYAHLGPTKEMLTNSRGLIFNSEPERALAQTLAELDGVPQTVLGMGIDFGAPGNANAFQEKLRQLAPGREPRPFLLYLGRRDPTKNAPLLIDFFRHLVVDNSLEVDLVLAGTGPVDIPPELGTRVIDVGLLTEQEKRDALAAALALVQPSVRESFAIVLLEAWREGAPVIANELCEVTREKCREANGGLCFRDYLEFREIVELLLTDPATARTLGEQGREHVREHYGWETIVENFLQFVKQHAARGDGA
jgi:glycosyltransferase involved in cell wall biosynthesis